MPEDVGRPGRGLGFVQKRRAHGRVHRLGVEGQIGRADPGVEIKHLVDADHRVVGGDPAAVGAGGRPGQAMLHPAQGMVGVEPGAVGGVEHRQARRRRLGRKSGDHGPVIGVAAPWRLAVGEGGKFPGRGVAQVALHVHRFMIADQRMHIAAGAAGLTLQSDHQVEDAPRLGAPVGHIAQLDEVSGPAAPGAGGVDQARLREHSVELGVVAVQVADDHHARHAFPAGPRRSWQGRPHAESGQEQAEKPDHSPNSIRRYQTISRCGRPRTASAPPQRRPLAKAQGRVHRGAKPGVREC